MTNDDDLQAIWQEIQGPTLDPDKVARKARRQRLKNHLITTGDIAANGVLGWILFHAYRMEFSWLVLLWLGASLLFGLYLSWYFYRIRSQSIYSLTQATSDYNAYLENTAKGHIKIGRRFIFADHIVMGSILLLVVLEHLVFNRPLLHELNDWLFAAGWSIFWYGLMYAYGRYKIAKGQKLLARLSDQNLIPLE